MSTNIQKDKLLTSNYCFILLANFLLYFAFYLLMPVFPFYLTEVFSIDKSIIGVVLSSYVVAALVIRPFSGFLIDTIARKPLYLVAYFIFTFLFAGYIMAGSLLMFVIFRVFHGLSFGAVSVAGNTIVIDITPSSRRGEALGYYGLSNNIAMAVGPMIGLFLHETFSTGVAVNSQTSFTIIFTIALISCVLGFIMAIFVKTPYKQHKTHTPISLDRFILLKGLPIAVTLILISMPYAMTTTYIAMYGKSIGIQTGIGVFFTLLAVGTAASRLFSGKLVDKGKITQVITFGLILVALCFVCISFCNKFIEINQTIGEFIYFAVALFLGVGFGSMFPAFNTMFVNLASNKQRGTATSTYLTSWDVGIGMGLSIGGYTAGVAGYPTTYFCGACLIAVAAIYFVFIITPYYHKNKEKTII